MSFVMEFDAKNNILRVTPIGRVTDAILTDIYATVARYVASHPPCRGITDFSEVTELEVSSNAIRRLARISPAFPAGYMRVLVAPKGHVYGMARMFQMLGEETRPDLHIVHTMDEAHGLLGVKSPEFSPVSSNQE
ncbi:MAG: hypothetical protein LAO56_11765 [Acidobacteriia bacterium]|nr:hypothetical protein [Terriglobia bacterium]